MPSQPIFIGDTPQDIGLPPCKTPLHHTKSIENFGFSG